MMQDSATTPARPFNLSGKTALITGGTGVLGSAMARGLTAAGAKVAIMGRRAAKADELAAQLKAEGYETLVLPADVLDKESLLEARTKLLETWGKLDILVNAAGGNLPTATAFGERTFSRSSPRRCERSLISTLRAAFCPLRSSAR